MAKNWWFKFDWDDWLGDEELSACSLETQGLWLRCICLMYRSDSFELTGTVEQLRRKLGVLPEELTRCLHDLKTTNAADVRFGNDDVRILSRRRQREVKAKENNRLYVAKHRGKQECKDDVRPQSKSKSKSKKKEEEIREEVAATTKPKLTDAEWLESLKEKKAYKGLDVSAEYEKAQVWAEANNRQCTRRFFVGWINRATPMDTTTEVKKGYDSSTDLLSPDYKMERTRTEFSLAAEIFFNSHHNDGTREKYEGMKKNWLDTSWGKGYEYEIDDYERGYTFQQRFNEAGQVALRV